MRDYCTAAHLYAMRYAEEQHLKIELTVEALRSWEKNPTTEKAAILDLGCGTGLLFPSLKEMAGSVVGLDLSRKMLKEAESVGGDLEGIHLILADAENTPLRDDQFDFIIALTLLQNMPNPIQVLKEAQRVAKENSVLVITGLKARFGRRAFARLLKKARLEAKLLKTTHDLKDHIAICRRHA